MRRALLFGLLALLALALAGAAQAQEAGCCCDPVAKTGSILLKTDCGPGFVYGGPMAIDECTTFCETAGPAAQECGAAAFTPPASNVSVKPVRGQRAFQLDWRNPCPGIFMNYINLSRCEGEGCTRSDASTLLSPVTESFIDIAEFKFNLNYTYRLTLNYIVGAGGGTNSAPVSQGGNLGDIECWGQTLAGEFCINTFYYDQYADYLKAFGYGGATGSAFASSFQPTVNTVFSTRLAKGFRCNDANRLSQTKACALNETCTAGGGTVRCVKPVPCESEPPGLPFGLFQTVASCEGSPSGSRYCFLDRSHSVADQCMACRPEMTCIDYRTEAACTRNSCGAGSCAWRDTIAGLGIGVCIDTLKSNCNLCTSRGNLAERFSGSYNRSYNAVFDRCTEGKAAALATPAVPCFYNKDYQVAADCSTVACTDYTPVQCASPLSGIVLGPTNLVTAKSADPCGIGVCQLEVDRCNKNADGSTGPGYQDCLQPNGSISRRCELDYFPPATTAVPVGTLGRYDYILFTIRDKLNASELPRTINASVGNVSGFGGYTIRACVTNTSANGSACSDARTFPLVINTSRLNIDNLELKSGAKAIANLTLGRNHFSFYTKDPFDNLEIVKSFQFTACANCSGPKLLEFKVVPSVTIGGIIYAYETRPVIQLFFNKPSNLITQKLTAEGGNDSIAITQFPAGNVSVTDYNFTPAGALGLGEHTFLVNARDLNGLFMDAPEAHGFVVDPSKRPGPCEDGVFAAGTESDVDCGQTCPGCENGKNCLADDDCKSLWCNAGICTASSCTDGIRNGRETDADCGGGCPGCALGQSCKASTDCGEGLACDPLTNTCQYVALDSDNDGVPDESDTCPGTGSGLQVDENGCADNQKFTCGDRMHDAWRKQYFGSVDCEQAEDTDSDGDGLTNFQEFELGTDPTKKDTDGDGWNDGIEFRKGTDPLDPDSHPKGFPWLLLLIILAALVIGGLVAYYVIRGREERARIKKGGAAPPGPVSPARTGPPPEAPEKEGRDDWATIDSLRRFAKESPPPEDKSYIPVGMLARLPKKGTRGEEALARLSAAGRGELVPRGREELPADPIARLRTRYWDAIPTGERAAILRSFRLLLRGKLSKAEIEELLRRLRITADYYRLHKDELEQELARWARGK